MTSVRRVLSVQSHVVHGYVGNRAAVFPLQLLGFDVDVINSVQFSCHTGYPKICGQKLNGEDLNVLAKGLADNQVLTHSHLLTGYIGTASFLREVLALLKMMPKHCRYICDPVMGDNGRLYVPEELIDVYREEVLPHVTVLTPNQFEAEKLTQQTITTIADAAAVCDKLHSLGPKIVFLTTLEAAEATNGDTSVAMMLSESGKQKWLLQLPKINGGPFTGTGDLAAAMMLAWTQLCPYEVPLALEITGAVLQSVIRNTIRAHCATTIQGKFVPPELRLIESKRIIEGPRVAVRCRPLTEKYYKGIIFDMDGTLTLPHSLNLTRIRERTGVPAGENIVPYLKKRHLNDGKALATAMAIIDEEEKAAFNPPQYRSGLFDFVEWTRHGLGLPLAIVTRNSSNRVQDFVLHAGLPSDTFSPIVTRESEMAGKPAPDPVLHCCRQWGVEPSDVLVVGDGIDDIKCGKAAGSNTVAMLRPGVSGETFVDSQVIEECASKAEADAEIAAAADFTVSSLVGLRRILQRSMNGAK